MLNRSENGKRKKIEHWKKHFMHSYEKRSIFQLEHFKFSFFPYSHNIRTLKAIASLRKEKKTFRKLRTKWEWGSKKKAIHINPVMTRAVFSYENERVSESQSCHRKCSWTWLPSSVKEIVFLKGNTLKIEINFFFDQAIY